MGNQSYAFQAEKCKPKELFIEVTNACTHRCLHCAPRSGEPLSEEMSSDLMLRVLAEAKHLGMTSLYVTGGEPFMRPECVLQLVECVGETTKKTIFTNGSIFNQALAQRLAKFGSSLRLEMSIFSNSPRIHDHLTQTPGSLVKMLESTEKYKSYGVDVRWAFITTGININDLEGVLKLASDINVAKVSIARLVPSGRARDNWRDLIVSSEQFAKMFVQLDQFKYKYDVKVVIGKTLSYEFLKNGAPPPSCNAAITRIFVQADGNVLPCPAFKDLDSFVAGNVHRSSLQDIWFSSIAFQNLRRLDLSDICPNCQYRYTCKGHCRAQQLHANKGNEFGMDPLCPIKMYNMVSDLSEATSCRTLDG